VENRKTYELTSLDHEYELQATSLEDIEIIEEWFELNGGFEIDTNNIY